MDKKNNPENGNADLQIDPKNFDSGFMDKKLITGCIISALVSVVTVFVMMKIGLNYHEEKIQSITENYASLDTRVKSIVESIADLNASIDSLKTDWKNSKENLSYIYTNLSSLQKDISVIKEELSIDTDRTEESVKKLSSEKGSFIEAFENLVKDGAPFDSFVESYAEKIDMKKYQTSAELIKFAQQNIKSLSDLKKDFASVGYKVFQTKFEESFWEKQKRVIKEKISEAIKIKKTDGESSDKVKTSSSSEKSKFEEAGKLLSDGKYADSVKILESLKIEDEDFGNLLSDIKKRQNLEDAFAEFKKEFMEMEGASESKDAKDTKKDKKESTTTGE